MENRDEEPAGVNTPESAALTGLANLFKLGFVMLVLVLLWILAVVVAMYYSYVSLDGSFQQGLATTALAALMLAVAVPVLFTVVLRRPLWHSIAVAILAAGILWLAALVPGALRDVLLSLGVGVWFVLAIDYYIVYRIKAWKKRMESEAGEASKNIRLVL
ncbi:hypothetical protein [Thioalkalivibrio sulfidiphilus]|uniref:hypothetical protein n=1 Tax=Thioalkalivibrio sulfidiphilus TaxID=1033854 RepID=UPI003B359C01